MNAFGTRRCTAAKESVIRRLGLANSCEKHDFQTRLGYWRRIERGQAEPAAASVVERRTLSH